MLTVGIRLPRFGPKSQLASSLCGSCSPLIQEEDVWGPTTVSSRWGSLWVSVAIKTYSSST